MAPVIRLMHTDGQRFKPIVCVTGQHREMLDQVLTLFEIKPDYDLGIMTPNQSLSSLAARTLLGLDEVLNKEDCDVVIVQGDTTTAMASALAAFHRQLPVAHVEAGLRTFDLKNPFPEEANRLLIDRLSSFCFAPTSRNRECLLAEGVPDSRIFVTGNTGIDALLLTRSRLEGVSHSKWSALWPTASSILADGSSRIALITLHRRESFGRTMLSLFNAIREMAFRYPAWQFVYPLHLNPNVRVPAGETLSAIPNVHLVEPLPYEAFVYLMDRSSLILTDSGGIQEEAPSLGKPVVVLRDTTERKEAIDAGTVIPGGTDAARLLKVVEPFLHEPDRCDSFGGKINPFGDGHAAEAIIDILWESHAREQRCRPR